MPKVMGVNKRKFGKDTFTYAGTAFTRSFANRHKKIWAKKDPYLPKRKVRVLKLKNKKFGRYYEIWIKPYMYSRPE